ncbi:MAG: hypothetical protein MJH10_14570 [Epibacterium sp.]|nr:hypothetical protein [Epibacterium sp.]NQX74751.1 hypothetical protein [Epibacterium sp.]
MNYLQLVNDFFIETDAHPVVTTLTGPTLEDDTEKAKVRIRDAWLEIQRKRNWNFRWAVDTFTTVASQRIYTLTDLGRVAGDDIVLDEMYLQDGTIPFGVINWRSTIGIYTQGTPLHVGERPDEALVLDPIPDAAYSIIYEYYRAPQVLVTDTDEPYMSPEFHKAIVWLAIKNYAREQGNEWRSLYEQARLEFANAYTDILNHYYPMLATYRSLIS